MSPTLNESSAIRRSECINALKICDGITFDFYTGLPHMRIPHTGGRTKLTIPTQHPRHSEPQTRLPILSNYTKANWKQTSTTPHTHNWTVQNYIYRLPAAHTQLRWPSNPRQLETCLTCGLSAPTKREFLIFTIILYMIPVFWNDENFYLSALGRFLVNNGHYTIKKGES